MKKILFYIFVVFLGSLQSQTLVGYWPFTGNAADSSGNGNDGILVNNPVLASDRYGAANRSYEFNGNNTYIIGISPGINFPVGSTPRTIAAWIKSNFYEDNDHNIFHYGTTGGGAPHNFHMNMKAPGIVWLGNGWGYGGITGNDFIGDTTWHFVVGIYEGPGTNMLRIYIDGRLKTSGQAPYVPNTGTGTPWQIARFMAAGQPAFSGRIDDVRLYSGAMNGSQILDLYNQTTTAPNLLSPPNGANGISTTPLLDWDSLVTSSTYRAQIAYDSLFAGPVWDSSGIERSQLLIPPGRLSGNVKYYWRVRNTINGERGPWSLVWSFTTNLVGLHQSGNEFPKEFFLYQNYPNPFNPKSKIKYQIANNQNSIQKVELTIYNVLGEKVAILVNKEQIAGNYEVEWDATKYSSGVYYYKLVAGDFTETKKMVLIK